MSEINDKLISKLRVVRLQQELDALMAKLFYGSSGVFLFAGHLARESVLTGMSAFFASVAVGATVEFLDELTYGDYIERRLVANCMPQIPRPPLEN